MALVTITATDVQHQAEPMPPAATSSSSSSSNALVPASQALVPPPPPPGPPPVKKEIAELQLLVFGLAQRVAKLEALAGRVAWLEAALNVGGGDGNIDEWNLEDGSEACPSPWQ